MKQIVIENPVLNSPFQEPKSHFKFDQSGITDEVVNQRRPSSYFIPVDSRRRREREQQLTLIDEWSSDRIRENDFVNRLRERVGIWRKGGYQYVTATTRKLLDYWTNPEREKPLFFAQIEAVETVVYLTEVAHKAGDNWFEYELVSRNQFHNPGLFRMALKMATGSGKTVVMAMLIAYHALNKLATPQDRRFTDRFLVVTPGITIRDRLRVLLPSDPENYYRQRDLLPSDMMEQLHRARIAITNYHAFKLREKEPVAKLTKSILAAQEGAFTETPDEMVSRVLRDLGGLSSKKEIIVINDEAHHCWRPKPPEESEEESYKGDDRKEAQSNAESARTWIGGLEAIQRKLGIKVIYDLSATPFFLKGSGYTEGTLFPWVVSDFSLLDAIESGIVKVPRVPIDDDAQHADGPTYRYIWPQIKEHLPKKGRGDTEIAGEPKLPVVLEGALRSLYANYEKTYRAWEADEDAQSAGRTPPVMIIVCNNTSVSKLVYDWVAGWNKKLPGEQTVAVLGNLPIFSNVQDGRWVDRPNTLLIDSEQLESDDGLSDEFKRVAAAQIEEFRHEYKQRFPGRNADNLTDEDILREVMNTVGKHGKLGEHIKCVVSVSMLTEGWDANTVTHILGIRAFSTQLLCEQVVGRALRRMSYAVGDDGKFSPEYAEVYGVPFSFIPTNGAVTTPDKPVKFTRVRALETRVQQEITFPKVLGYRYELPGEKLVANFSDPKIHMTLSTEAVPSWTENAPIIGAGASEILPLDLETRREQEVDFLLAKLVLEKYFRTDGQVKKDRQPTDTHDPLVKAWLFPQVLEITRQWRKACLHLNDNTRPQMLLLVEFAHDAADRIFSAIAKGESGEKVLLPRLYDYNPEGSTRAVDFDTAKPVYPTGYKCHVSHVVCDSTWEEHVAQVLEDMPEVIRYVKNQGLGFTIPYTINGESRSYLPDFIVQADDGHGGKDPLNLIVEVSGEKRKDKEAKVLTARTLWVPAINNHGGFGRWDFIEITDPWDAETTIRAFLNAAAMDKGVAANG